MASAPETAEAAGGLAAGEQAVDADAGGLHAHPSDRQYVIIAAILGGITAVEVALSYLKIGALTNPALLLLAITKFAMVALFFMHLRFDNRLLRRLFATGLVLAVLVYLAVMLTFGVFIKR